MTLPADPNTPLPATPITDLIGRYDAIEWETYDPEFLKAFEGVFGNRESFCDPLGCLVKPKKDSK